MDVFDDTPSDVTDVTELALPSSDAWQHEQVHQLVHCVWLQVVDVLVFYVRQQNASHVLAMAWAFVYPSVHVSHL